MNRTAIVTGASRGIGLACARMLLEMGFHTVLCARKAGEELLRLQDDYPDALLFVPADIALSKDRARIFEETLRRFGPPEVLVNNAGVAPPVRKDLLDICEEDFDYVMDINLKGTYFLTQEAARLMIPEGKGYIINTGSISAETVSLNRGEYCISKAGVRMLTRLFAVRLAEYGIGVFEISPGVIDTDMIASVREKYRVLAQNGAIPARRLGKPEDEAKILRAIVSGELDYASGSVIHCDGGMHIPVL